MTVCCYLQRPVVIEDCDLISLLAVLFVVMGPPCVCYGCLLLPAASSGDRGLRLDQFVSGAVCRNGPAVCLL